ncbi:MAG TPA: DUF1080 domain-containing protein [Saprospiraceae bacterium]|nr:DUF1080 domain-containing protein [Saprospiraceae bacterium]HMQ82835.1 DUF1080 domain-containing protein [Saprospiraceae bacterium]
MKRWTPWLLSACLMMLLSACGKEGSMPNTAQRANDPWVFRSVLDGKARMLTLALNDKLWASYSAETGSLYRAWQGSVNFDGAVYTTVHGPQPSSIGDIYFENEYANPWSLAYNGQTLTPEIQYRGHRFEGEQVYINYELKFKGAPTLLVSERPEYLALAEGKQAGFERVFYVEGLPKDATLSFSFNLHSVVSEKSIDTDGELFITEKTAFQTKGLIAQELKGHLKLRNDGPTRMAVSFTKFPLLENENKVLGAEGDAALPRGARLIERSDCKSCHNTYVQTIGPAYVAVAKRYPNTTDNVTKLVAKIKNGGAGVWGEAAMTPHPDLDDLDLQAMVEYIMSLDADEEVLQAAQSQVDLSSLTFAEAQAGLNIADLYPGLLIRVIQSNKPLNRLADINFNQTALYEGVVGQVLVQNSEFKGLEDHFALEYTGYLNVPKDNNYVFRLASDDGSRLYIDGQTVIDHDGLHGAENKDGEIALRQGLHPFRLVFFQGSGGKHVSLEWKSFDDDGFNLIPAVQFFHSKDQQPGLNAKAPPMAQVRRIPGDGYPVATVHPSYDIAQARPNDFSPKVGGMDFFSDGRLVVSTWDAEGAVYVVENAQSGDPSKMSYKKIARGLAEPLGLKVVDDTIYILQKQELTKLIDHDGDQIIDEYYTVCNSWKVSANFHEFAFGLAYKDGYFYGALAIAILPGGASANPQIPDRGKAIRISRSTGKLEFVAIGLRTPNGVGIGVDNEIFIADNQGDWLPSSKILHVSQGDFFGSRAVDSARVASLPVKQPLVWLPQDEIGNSPSTPLALNDGPYKGQMIHGEVTNGGVKRVFVEKINGAYQGCVFRFIQGLEAGVNRMVWGPDGALYIGGIGSTGNWQHTGTLWYGLQRLKYNGKTAFEMLAVRAKTNGVEIEFTEPLEEGTGWNPKAYKVQQWRYLPTRDYGGPKLDLENLLISSASVSSDRKKVFLELPGIKAGHVIYIQLPSEWVSAAGNELWSTEAWYTLNAIPENALGTIAPAPETTPMNALSVAEQAAGWRLLFDGQSLSGWHNYNKPGVSVSPAWKVVEGSIMYDPSVSNPDGTRAGGDIITDAEFENYELRLEWKIGPCGNSGIMFNVVEDKKYDYPWLTGPEMQVLDNSCHPDSRFEKHRAGDLYDMIACKYESVYPAGEWNKVRIVIKDGKSQFWLNGRQVVTFEMFNEQWASMIQNSKFKDMPAFGKSKKGRICLQDHGDPVWFRNIKVKSL